MTRPWPCEGRKEERAREPAKRDSPPLSYVRQSRGMRTAEAVVVVAVALPRSLLSVHATVS